MRRAGGGLVLLLQPITALTADVGGDVDELHCLPEVEGELDGGVVRVLVSSQPLQHLHRVLLWNAVVELVEAAAGDAGGSSEELREMVRTEIDPSKLCVTSPEERRAVVLLDQLLAPILVSHHVFNFPPLLLHFIEPDAEKFIL